MIRRLRWKTIAYSMASIFVFLLLILGTINIVNFSTLAANADEVTALLAKEGGKFTPPNEAQSQSTASAYVLALGPEGPQEGGQPMDPIGPETRMSARYFTVKIDASGTASLVDLKLTERTATPEEVLSWGASLTGREKGWTRTYFRFRTYSYEDYTYVSVIDYSRELSPSYRILWSSLIGSGIGLLVAFLVLIPVSKLMVKPLEASMKKQQRFISDASHELKTPITVISANNEIIEATQGESDSTKAIARQVARLNVMIKNLNALARLEEGEKDGDVAVFDLAQASRESVEAIRSVFERRSIQFSSEIPETMDFKGSEAKLRKLLSILLDNASKYALTFAEFHLYKNGDRVAIKVINDAEGIEEGSLDRVFERFYRSDLARASEVEGSGIGLSIAKQIVDDLHGRISAKGEAGRFIIKAEF